MCPSLVFRLKSVLAKQKVNLLAASVALALAFSLPLASSGWNATDPGSPTDSARAKSGGAAEPLLLAAEPANLDLGTVSPGSRTEATFRLTNPTEHVVFVDQPRTSCECLHVELSNPALGPGASVEGRVVLDLTSDPGFRGNLAIDVWGTAGDGQRVFSMLVSVRVSTDPEVK